MKKYIAAIVIVTTLLCASGTRADTQLISSSGMAGQAVGLRSTTGFEIGGQISDYRYQEHIVANSESMHEAGPKYGIIASGTYAFAHSLFAKADVRFAYGENDYSSPVSGKINGVPDYLWDVRLLGGRDVVFEHVPVFKKTINFSVSPYLGFGYRNLSNDLRGTTSAGFSGYRRDSQYFYLPVGVTQRFRVHDDARIDLNLEYDYLLSGEQDSQLSDAGSTFPNVTNDQNDGYGLRGSLLYEEAHWSFGPFFDYWNISQSKSASFSAAGIAYSGFEPHNQTIEYGVQVSYKFFK